MRRREFKSGRPSIAAITAAIVLSCLLPAPGSGGEPTSLVELESFSDVTPPGVYGISGDGSTAFGTSRVDDAGSASTGIRPIRWSAAGQGLPLSVPASDEDLPNGAPAASSFDGSTIVGTSDRYEASVDLGTSPMRWSADDSGTTLAEFETDSQGKRYAEARDISADGSTVCGIGFRYDPNTHLQIAKDAIRWDSAGVATVLASPGDGTGARVADALTISGDGTRIGGFARRYVDTVPQGDRPVLWSANGSVTELPISGTSVIARSGEASAISFDGSRAFGTLDEDTDPRIDYWQNRIAVLWTNAGAPVEIGPRAALGDLPPYGDVLVGCSEAGTRAVGYANLPSGPRGFVWTEGSGTIDLTTLYPQGAGYTGTSTPRAISADGSTVVGRSANGGAGEAIVWRNGQMQALREILVTAGVDLDAAGWDTFDDAIACSSDGSVVVGIGTRNGSVAAFRAKINDAPTLTTPTPVAMECTGGQNFVDLSITANDANSADRLTVKWKVDGTMRQTSTNVVPGTVVTFLYDYPDGEHAVTIEVSDGNSTTAAGTTVSVVDTTAPSIVVAPNVVVPTAPGKAFATGVTLTPPDVEDLCDGSPQLTNDAPEIYPLGQTIVKWTAKDKDGNVSVGAQRVTVVDREKPKITGARNLTVRVDQGQPFATVRLSAAKATDNVPQGLKVTSTAKTRYPVGKSTATWTAKDAAGNQATWSAIVTVINRPPVANAGTSVTITTTTERGARVTLDGSRSSDPDGHDLTYLWSAPGIRFPKPTTAKTAANFSVGTKTVKLTVTDEAGAKKTASVRVTVKLKNAKRRPRGSAANAAFAEIVQMPAKKSSSAPSASSSASDAEALVYAAAAHRIGIELGDHVRWDEGQSPDDAFLRYAERRESQRRYGQLAAERFLDSFIESGDEASLLASMHAFSGVAHAAEDLTER